MELQERITLRRHRDLVGRTVEVLVEGPHEESDLLLCGRTEGMAPEIDGQVILTDAPRVLFPGEIVEARVDEAHPHDLVGAVVAAPERRRPPVSPRPPPPRRRVEPRVRLRRPPAWAIATSSAPAFHPSSGTAGTLAALASPSGWRLRPPLWGFIAATLCVAGAGIWAADRTAARVHLKDPGIVVVDEAAGLMVTLIGVPIDVVSVIGAFFLFRAMDVLKPPPARQAEALPGGWGIMTDDLIAGLFANLLLRAALWALHALR